MLAQTSTSKQDAAFFAEMLSLPNDGRVARLTKTFETAFTSVHCDRGWHSRRPADRSTRPSAAYALWI
jgi:hypothetical protein